MLAVARESRGFTQTGLARKIGVNQSTYSRHEAGVTSISDSDLEAIGCILDYPAAFFSQPDTVYGFASPVFYHRKRSRLSTGDQRAIQARLNIFRFHVVRLLQGVDVDHAYDIPMMPIGEGEYDSPEQVAELLRCAWKLPMGPIDDLAGVMEAAGIVIRLIDFGTMQLDAVVQVAADGPPVILANRLVPGDRLRFTLAHELGHLVMHRHPSPEMESEADRFAAEFLLPARDIKPQLRGVTIHKLPDLKLQWRASMASLIYRSKTLGTISERQARSLFMRLSQNGWRVKEPCPIDHDQPHVLQDLLDAYFGHFDYSVAEVAKLMNATEKSFRADYLPEPESPGLRLVDRPED